MYRFMSVCQLFWSKSKENIHFCQAEYLNIAFKISSVSISSGLIAKDKLHFTTYGIIKAMLCAHWVKYLLLIQLSMQNLLIYYHVIGCTIAI